MGEEMTARSDGAVAVKKNVKSVLKKLRVLQIRAIGFAEASMYRAILRVSRGSKATAPSSHVLIAAPGGGNIGDQAMLESFVGNVDGTVQVIVRSESDFVWDTVSGTYEVAVLPSLLYGNGAAHIRDFKRYLRLLLDATSVSVIGADIMDGAYNPKASVRRSNLIMVAAKQGVAARILGFSWNESPHPAASAALKRATGLGVRLFLRDPISFARAQRAQLGGCSLVADTVFSHPMSSSGRDIADEAESRNVVLVNASALVHRRVDLVEGYEPMLRFLLDRLYKVVLVPHVIRPNGDDLELLRRLHEKLNDADVELVDRLMSPAEISDLLTHARFVITGRMHLGILALRMGVPPVVLATQGKVEGLFEMFGTPELALNPYEKLSTELLDRVQYVDVNADALRESIAAKLSDVVELSQNNFRGLA
ncbi:polysaccharide pyruvyl transferase family protein [Rhodococcus pyridinivorans]|uniref:polysaccharide pyruvyl transferase family protein n=1 Tax=Rhodococcus pyridinivorans TaxID=103816 RepID=UPI001E6579B0|nr:polysaccharide pyruvyl transferase family protein [Rhodococcus pyridinivorans]MCD5422611.1 polysaccharide pyruvyl transferase family protein [Rhodococcus pyridinivorans]